MLNSGFARAARVSDLEYGFADGPCHGSSGQREREGETKTKACSSYCSLFLIMVSDATAGSKYHLKGMVLKESLETLF